MATSVIVAGIIVAMGWGTLVVWMRESTRRKDEIRRTVWSAVTSLHVEDRPITLLSVLQFLHTANAKLDPADVLSALEARVRGGHLERFTTDARRWRHRQAVSYRLVSPQMFSANADAEEQITYEAVTLLDERGFEAFVTAVDDLTKLGSKRTLKVLTELTRKGWLEEYKVPSASSDDVLFAYRRVRDTSTTAK